MISLDIIEKLERNKSSTLMLDGNDLDDLLTIMRKLRQIRERKTIKRLTRQREVKIPKDMMLG